MSDRLKSVVPDRGGDLEFLIYDSDRSDTIYVVVSEEAVEDYRSMRQIPDDVRLVDVALADLIEAADRVYDRAGDKPRKVIVTTSDLNPRY